MQDGQKQVVFFQRCFRTFANSISEMTKGQKRPLKMTTCFRPSCSAGRSETGCFSGHLNPTVLHFFMRLFPDRRAPPYLRWHPTVLHSFHATIVRQSENNNRLAHPFIQPTNPPSHQSTGQPANQPTNQPTNEPTSQPAIQPSHQPTNQSINQTTN